MTGMRCRSSCVPVPSFRKCPSCKAWTSDRTVRSSCASMHRTRTATAPAHSRSEEHTSELQSPCNLVCRLLLEKKNSLHMGVELGAIEADYSLAPRFLRHVESVVRRFHQRFLMLCAWMGRARQSSARSPSDQCA